MTKQPHEIARVDTPLGAVVLRVDGNAEHIKSAITMTEANPELPKGMFVTRTVLFDVRLDALADGTGAQIALSLEGDTVGTPETGQWLESVAFAGAAARMNLATRDAAWMLSYGADAGRVPARLRIEDASSDHAAWCVSFSPRGLIVTVALAKGETMTCPFAVAFVSASDADPASTWFAVDGALP
jgi:hypothetical protein